MVYIYLLIAIISEVIATNSLKACESFTKLIPSIIVVLGYISSFYFLSLVLKTMPIGIAYAIWCGLGIVLVCISGIVVYKEVPDLPAIIGMATIFAGVVIINVFSKTSVH